MNANIRRARLVVAATLLFGSASADAQILDALERARIETARVDAQALLAAAEMAQADGRNGCPTATDLVREGYVSASRRTTDPWNHPYLVECAREALSVRSAGPDGRGGTADDIVVRSTDPRVP